MSQTLVSDYIEEYKLVAEQTGNMSDRRQVTNDIYVALNSLLVTGVAFLISTPNFKTWKLTVILGGIMLVSLIINITWLELIRNYKTLIDLRIEYLKAMEEQLFSSKFNFSVLGIQPKGVYQFESEKIYKKRGAFGFSNLERNVALIFLFIYPIVAIGAASFTLASLNHVPLPF